MLTVALRVLIKSDVCGVRVADSLRQSASASKNKASPQLTAVLTGRSQARADNATAVLW